ncbi:MAG: hypothetical protein AAGE88_23280, partial [Actinomycetota bacterium]
DAENGGEAEADASEGDGAIEMPAAEAEADASEGDGAIEMPAAEADVSAEADESDEGGAEDLDAGQSLLSDATETIDLTAAAPVSTFVNGNGHSNN